ncbi:effector-associated domain EAD1-containing protein [Streptomyces sp. NRRL B-24484]|uniref:effector-associated domain EAD1-containing protein n=1 Tax=Streptomyces sp. NRRL B-24484 TaxID=1463833 RepID=UPI0004C0A1E8|nr:effector-associated domain EAD1-containing protein [Streptomyces sp. NRRL B-24484]
MRLSGPDRRHLVEAVVNDYTLPDLEREISYLGRRLAAISTGGDLRTITHEVVEEAERAGWIEEFLDALRCGRFPAVAALAGQLLAAVPTTLAGLDDTADDPYVTDLLGQRLFLDRTLLRTQLKDLVSDSRSRVLLVTGPRCCGKSYTWYLVSHVAQQLQTFKPILVDLSEWADQVCTPCDLMSSVASQLKLPEPTVDQYAQGAAQARRLRDWLVGQLYDESVRAKYLLVVDSLDHVPLQADTAALIDHLAGAAIRERLPGLRVLLLGYGRTGLGALDSVLTEPVGTIDRRVLCDFFGRLAAGLDTEIAPPVLENIVDRMLDMLPDDRAAAIRQLPGTVRDTANAVFDRQVLR